MEKVHQQNPGVIESLFDRTTDYLETRADLIKLKAVKKTSEVVSGIVSAVVLSVIGLFFFIVLNIGLGLWIGELLGKNYFGFFALAGFYVLVGVIIFASRNKWLKTPVINSMIKNMHS